MSRRLLQRGRNLDSWSVISIFMYFFSIFSSRLLCLDQIKQCVGYSIIQMLWFHVALPVGRLMGWRLNLSSQVAVLWRDVWPGCLSWWQSLSAGRSSEGCAFLLLHLYFHWTQRGWQCKSLAAHIQEHIGTHRHTHAHTCQMCSGNNLEPQPWSCPTARRTSA